MKRLLALVSLCGALSLAQNSAIFPGAASTTANLGVATNRAQTTLTLGINSTATSIPVTSSGQFKAGSFATIDSEIVAVCSIPDGNHLNVGVSACPNVDGRGVDSANGGGAAASHLSASVVQGRIVAWHVNQSAAEIVAIEAKLLGPRSYGAKGDGSTDDATAFQSALSAGSGTIPLTPGTYIIGSELTMSTANQRIRCEPGAILKAKAGYTGGLITITGAGEFIEGCTFDGNGQGADSTILVYPNAATSFQFLGNTIKNTVKGQYPFRCDSCVTALIQGNTMTSSIAGGGLTIFGSSKNVLVTGNAVTASGSAFDVQGGAGGTAVISKIVVSGNAAQTSIGFCYEGGPFGGASGSELIFQGNTCIITNTTGTASCEAVSNQRACGGISVVGSTDSIVSGNIISGASQNIDIAAIEVGSARIQVVGNTISTGGGSSGGPSGIQGYCKQCRIEGNTINGWSPAASSNTAGIAMLANANQTNADDTVIANNVIVFSGNPSVQSGIWLPCNSAAGSQNRNIIIGNVIVGPGTANANYGINVFAGDAAGCTNAGAIIANNQISSVQTGLQLPSDTGLVIFNNKQTTVTTPFNCASCTYADGIVPGNLVVNATGAAAANLDVEGTALVTGNLKGTGTQFFTGGTSIGKNTTSVQTLDVNGTENHNGFTCFSLKNNSVSNCQDTTNESSPLVEWDGGDGSNFYRGRVQMLAGGTWDFSSADGAPIHMHDGGSNMLDCTTIYCILANNSGLTFGSIASCTGALEGAIANVADSTTNTWGAAYTVGGGANHVQVRCNGTNWTVVGK